VAVAGLHVALPAPYRVNPRWVVPAVLLVLLAVIKPWAKLLMIVEACVSLGVGALVIARAVNILQ
jgi:hypothetical protein